VLREITHYARDSRLDAEVIEESIEVVSFDDG
jgi:hypothetical protein